MTVQTFANGDTNYVSKLNSNFSGLDASITTLLSQVGALVNNPNSTLPLFNALFGQSMALIDTGSYTTTGSGSTLSVAAGYAWLPASSSVVQKLTNTDFSFSGLSAGTYYVHIGADGTVTYNTTSTASIYSVVWTGSAFGAITLLVPVTQFEDIKNKAVANGYASLDSGGNVPVAQVPILGVVQNANKVLAGPTMGADALPTMRALVAADLPVMVGSGATHAIGAVPDPGASAGTTKYLCENGSWAVPPGTGPSGTVTSVGLSLPAIFNVTNSPVTGADTLTGTLANQNANLVWAGPSTGAAASPTFRTLAEADLPAQPYDMYGYFPGKPAASDVMWIGTTPRAVTLPQNLTGSYGKALVAATSTTNFDIQVNGVSKGTMSFASSATTATFTFANAVTTAAGDIVKIIAPATPDATLSGVYQTLIGTRA